MDKNLSVPKIVPRIYRAIMRNICFDLLAYYCAMSGVGNKLRSLPEKDILGVKIAIGRRFIFRIQEDNL